MVINDRNDYYLLNSSKQVQYQFGKNINEQFLCKLKINQNFAITFLFKRENFLAVWHTFPSFVCFSANDNNKQN